MKYQCSEYANGHWIQTGYFHEQSQTPVIVTGDDCYEDQEIGFLAIGHSGCGGIDFGFRQGHKGLWAFYPIDQEFKFMANSVEALARGWCSGELTV